MGIGLRHGGRHHARACTSSPVRLHEHASSKHAPAASLARYRPCMHQRPSSKHAPASSIGLGLPGMHHAPAACTITPCVTSLPGHVPPCVTSLPVSRPSLCHVPPCVTSLPGHVPTRLVEEALHHVRVVSESACIRSAGHATTCHVSESACRHATTSHATTSHATTSLVSESACVYCLHLSASLCSI
jgi:hypothetical protein